MEPREREGRPALVLLRGGELGRLFSLEGELTVGRDDSNAIVLDLSSVSRQHARVWEERGGIRVEDLGSRNGTFVNEVAVQGSVLLRDGDRLRLGDAILKFLHGSNVEASYHEEIHRLAMVDPVTGLANKRALLEFVQREVARSSRHARPLCLAMMDIDHFKRLNDAHGHLAGDHVLRGLASLLNNHVRGDELAARYGGEEFAFVLPEATLEEARGFCERIRRAIASHGFEFEGDALPVTVSLGVAACERDDTAEGLIGRADDRLYRAKRAGRNLVVSA